MVPKTPVTALAAAEVFVSTMSTKFVRVRVRDCTAGLVGAIPEE
jgi:hypothetical protein